jgi:hypothetical protein
LATSKTDFTVKMRLEGRHELVRRVAVDPARNLEQKGIVEALFGESHKAIKKSLCYKRIRASRSDRLLFLR